MTPTELADRIEAGVLYMRDVGALLESEHCLIVSALRATTDRASAVPSEEIGISWRNDLSEAEREQWMRAAGNTGRAVDAWLAYLTRHRQLFDAAKTVIETFERDEAQGYRSRDRQFAIDIMRPLLNTPPTQLAWDEMWTKPLHDTNPEFKK